VPIRARSAYGRPTRTAPVGAQLTAPARMDSEWSGLAQRALTVLRALDVANDLPPMRFGEHPG